MVVKCKKNMRIDLHLFFCHHNPIIFFIFMENEIFFTGIFFPSSYLLNESEKKVSLFSLTMRKIYMDENKEYNSNVAKLQGGSKR